MTDSLGGDASRRGGGRVKRKSCPCGSGRPRRILEDARGIFCAYVCTDCEKRVRAKYRADIFSNPNYWTEEPIEEE